MVAKSIEQEFPGLVTSGYTITSQATPRYNCIAWAASRDDCWWCPGPDGFWPLGVPRERTLAAYEAAFATVGYYRTEDESVQANIEKIAIYVDRLGRPSHAARQLSTGHWTSKLGQDVDIQHNTLEALNGDRYGSVAVILARQIHRVF